MQHLEGSGTPVLYIGRKVLKGYWYWKVFFSETNWPMGEVDLHCCLVSRLKTTVALYSYDFLKIAGGTVILKIVRLG